MEAHSASNGKEKGEKREDAQAINETNERTTRPKNLASKEHSATES